MIFHLGINRFGARPVELDSQGIKTYEDARIVAWVKEMQTLEDLVDFAREHGPVTLTPHTGFNAWVGANGEEVHDLTVHTV